MQWSKREPRKMPSKKDISEYWMGRPDSVKKFGHAGVHISRWDDELPPDECWACGDAKGPLERCHIYSRNEGGPDTLDNLVIMCSNCHLESEDIPPEGFWFWISKSRAERWVPDFMHTLRRMDNAGISSEVMSFLIEDMGPLEATKTMCGMMGFAFDPKCAMAPLIMDHQKEWENR